MAVLIVIIRGVKVMMACVIVRRVGRLKRVTTHKLTLHNEMLVPIQSAGYHHLISLCKRGQQSALVLLIRLFAIAIILCWIFK